MELAFGTQDLRSLCADHAKATREYGEAAADALRARIADLRAVTYLADLPTMQPEIVDGDSPRLLFQLRNGWTIVARVGHRVIPRTPEGALDIARIRRVLIVEIAR